MILNQKYLFSETEQKIEKKKKDTISNNPKTLFIIQDSVWVFMLTNAFLGGGWPFNLFSLINAPT